MRTETRVRLDRCKAAEIEERAAVVAVGRAAKGSGLMASIVAYRMACLRAESAHAAYERAYDSYLRKQTNERMT